VRLRQLFEDVPAKKIVAVMPGGFHPFHPGHKSLYDWAVETFGRENVYVAATNDTKSRPFPFDVKIKLAQMAGVPANRFIQVKSPFNALSYNNIIGDTSQTALVFVRSEKDKTSHPLPDQVRKSDGNMGYLISYNDGDLETADTHGYLAYGPTIDFDFSGMSIKSASELRAAWPEMSDEDKLQAAELMYPGNAQTATQLLNKALGDTEAPVGEDASKDEEDDFHRKLDKLVHKTFGHSSDEKKMRKAKEKDSGMGESDALLDPLKGAYGELFGKQPKEEAPEKIALDQAMEKYKNNPKGLKAWLMKNRNILVWLNTSGSQMMDIVKQRIRETTTAGGIASSMGSGNDFDDITLQRILKFADDRDRYNTGTSDAVMSTKGTNELIAKARAQAKRERISNTQAHAHNKDGVHKQGFKKVKFDPVELSPELKVQLGLGRSGKMKLGDD